MLRFLYSALYRAIFPFILLRLLLRSRQAPAYAKRWSERLGFFPSPSLRKPIWVHAVSVGETIAAVPMIRKLQLAYPNRDIVVTTMTPTGSERVKALLGDDVFHVYAPYDLSGAVRRFLKKVRPSILIIMETELWPNMIHYTHQMGAPVLLANGRLSAKSAKGYQKVAGLATPMLLELDQLAVQYDDEAQRFLQLGVSPHHLQATGSIKFDFDVARKDVEKGDALKRQFGSRPVWIAASTHDGEDEIVLAAHRKLLSHYSDALLILVPRHPERFGSVFDLSVSQLFHTEKRSSSKLVSAECQILIGDTMGEMMSFFAAGDVAFVGGSLINRGGHNPLEPAALSLPILSGPHVFNFEKVFHQLSEAGAVKFVGSSELIAARLEEFFDDEDYRKEVGAKALVELNKNRGALERLLALIDQQLDK